MDETGGSEGSAAWEETALDDVEFVVVDLETTGTSPAQGHRVTEVAAVGVRRGVATPLFESLVNPRSPVPHWITRLTGISDAMVYDAPPFEAIAEELAAHLAGRVFVAHNAAFDWSFLDAEYLRMVQPGIGRLAVTRVCTVQLARRFLRHLPRRNLDAVCAHYGIVVDNRHRAMGDARATAEALVCLLGDAASAGTRSLGDLLRPGSSRSPRARRALPSWTDGRPGA
ncbi:MAG: 3'-5' exonuclease [Gemmatimonadaceae bacterium]|nr:3'-5' exonuclease [Gemmatimonadaceae bacterium]